MATALAEEPAEKEEKATSGGVFAVIETDRGAIRIKLEDDRAPLTVANFVNLAQHEFYDGLTFHRVIKGFMIQGGDPDGSGRGGPGYKFRDEFHPELRHDSAGILSMANSGPGTNGSQFFITHGPTPHLNDKHSIFGKVVDGQDVVDAITQGDKMNKVTIEGNTSGLLATYKDDVAKWNEALAKLPSKAQREQAQQERDKAANAAKEKRDVQIAEHVKKLEAELGKSAEKTESGLFSIVLEPGTGESPKPTDKVKVHYTGWLLDGSEFDSSHRHGKPAEFLLNQMIPGWIEGVGLMKVGEKRKLIIPPELAYGERARGPDIPPNSPLVFDIELIAITTSGG
jgi:cyclophilin family peptidyl-prolyl cis-trans isomerase